MALSYEKDLKITAAYQREEDRSMRQRLRRYKKAFHVGQVITSEMDRDLLFEVIIHQTNEVLESERSTVFLHDDKANQLWSLVGIGLKKKRNTHTFGLWGSRLGSSASDSCDGQ